MGSWKRRVTVKSPPPDGRCSYCSQSRTRQSSRSSSDAPAIICHHHRGRNRSRPRPVPPACWCKGVKREGSLFHRSVRQGIRSRGRLARRSRALNRATPRRARARESCAPSRRAAVARATTTTTTTTTTVCARRSRRVRAGVVAARGTKVRAARRHERSSRLFGGVAGSFSEYDQTW